MMKRSFLSLILCCLAIPAWPVLGFAQSVTPFAISNLNPLVQIYGLPAPEKALLTSRGRSTVRLSFDGSNHFVAVDAPEEDLYIDGETHRFILALRYGLTHRAEVGLDLAYLRHEGGFQDDFIKNFHETIGKDSLRRDRIEHSQILFRYQRNGTDELRLDESAEGIGDIRLTGGWRLYRNDSKTADISLRGTLKLPTGDEKRLLGSGSTDLALSMAASRLWKSNRELGFYGNAGVLLMTEGDVLPDLQRQIVGFGTLGLGWRLWSPLILKGQLDYHTPFYRDALDGLTDYALQGTAGATISFTKNTSLDLAVVENFKKSTSPDVVFHIALRVLF